MINDIMTYLTHTWDSNSTLQNEVRKRVFEFVASCLCIRTAFPIFQKGEKVVDFGQTNKHVSVLGNGFSRLAGWLAGRNRIVR